MRIFISKQNNLFAVDIKADSEKWLSDSENIKTPHAAIMRNLEDQLNVLVLYKNRKQRK